MSGLEDIMGQTIGNRRPEKIRNYIIQEYPATRIQFVFLDGAIERATAGFTGQGIIYLYGRLGHSGDLIIRPWMVTEFEGMKMGEPGERPASDWL